MNNHEKLIREIAEEMAKAYYTMCNCDDTEADWNNESLATKEGYIMDEWFRARIAVKHMADAVDKALRGAGWRYHEERRAYLWFEGLIPEAGNEEKKTHTMSDTIAEVAAIRAFDEEMYRKTGKTYLQRIKEEQDAGKEDYQNEQ